MENEYNLTTFVSQARSTNLRPNFHLISIYNCAAHFLQEIAILKTNYILEKSTYFDVCFIHRLCKIRIWKELLGEARRSSVS